MYITLLYYDLKLEGDMMVRILFTYVKNIKIGIINVVLETNENEKH
jgi:hypothetical protein